MMLPSTLSPRAARAVTALPAAAALALCVTAARPAQARSTEVPSFSNGGFESPVVPANAFTTFITGDRLGAWKVVSGNVDLVGSGFWQAAEGNQSVDLDGDVSGTIEQSVPTRPGGCYTLTFSLAGNPEGGPAVKEGFLRVTQHGVNRPAGQRSFAFDTTGKTRMDMGYVPQRFRFRALGPAVTLAFGSSTAGAFGPVIDAVSVTPAHPMDCRLGHN
ncbi:choice-of-anchor C family protein [Actinoallomurus rhizosphaericola]|uniref:choice-of-anchor C family protein n=1 Tax=Actinoallomurus rhizosphaericola TaxID=2952536 RepID=UPI002093FC8E|nr:choice-of-anchor C family protein [Actinoallomurus rhizosphaericola]MCO5996391.1 choice-of-anchor C family protein [Actinoallomurus rhizosphaericola]